MAHLDYSLPINTVVEKKKGRKGRIEKKDSLLLLKKNKIKITNERQKEN